MRRSSPMWAVALAVSGSMTAVVGCSSDSATPASSIPQETTTTVARVDDGILTIGLLTPQGSANADIGQAIGTAAQLAVTEINAAGGYGGEGVKLITADEGVVGV